MEHTVREGSVLISDRRLLLLSKERPRISGHERRGSKKKDVFPKGPVLLVCEEQGEGGNDGVTPTQDLDSPYELSVLDPSRSL